MAQCSGDLEIIFDEFLERLFARVCPGLLFPLGFRSGHDHLIDEKSRLEAPRAWRALDLVLVRLLLVTCFLNSLKFLSHLIEILIRIVKTRGR